MKSYFLEIEKFTYRILIVKITIIQWYQGIYHCIFKIFQIFLHYSIDHHTREGKLRNKIFPQRNFFTPSRKREMKFFDSFLSIGDFVRSSEIMKQLFCYLQISKITYQTNLSYQRISKTFFHYPFSH